MSELSQASRISQEVQAVTVNGVSLETLRIPATEPNKPPLVLLHEGLGSVAMWRDFPSALAERTGAEVIAYSRRGYGQSSPRPESFTVDYMHREALEVLPSLLTALDITNPLLIGHSDGGSIALIAGGGLEMAFAGLVVMAPHVFVEDLSITSIEAAKIAFETTNLPEKLGRYHRDAAHTFGGWNDIWLHPDFRSWNIEASLPGITCPVLAIQGADDQYGTLAQIDSVVDHTGGRSSKAILADCGHSPHRDQPEATLSAISDFLETLSA